MTVIPPGRNEKERAGEPTTSGQEKRVGSGGWGDEPWRTNTTPEVKEQCDYAWGGGGWWSGD